MLAGVLLSVFSLWAHHGLAAFDTTHTVKMEGTVTGPRVDQPPRLYLRGLERREGQDCQLETGVGEFGDADPVWWMERDDGEARRPGDGAGLSGQGRLALYVPGKDLAS